MLTKIIEFYECKDLIGRKDQVIYSSDRSLHIYTRNNEVIQEYSASDKISKLFDVNASLIATNSRGQIITIEGYDSIDSLGIHPSQDIRVSSVIAERYVRYYTRGENAISGFYDLINKTVVFESGDFFGRELYGDFIFELGSKLKGINIVSGDYIIEIEATTVSISAERFERILCVRDERIVAIMSDGCICELDLTDKSFIKWDLFDDEFLSHKTLSTEETEEIYKSRFGTFSKRSAIYLSERNKVVGFEYGVYWEIDLNEKLLYVTSKFDEFASNDISGCWSNVIVYEGIIYFISDQSYQKNQNHKIIGFDINLQKVVTQWSLPISSVRRGFSITGPVKVYDDLIAAIEQDSTCHLFNVTLNQTATS